MPTYEYICDSCGHSFERLQSITAKALRKCPKCGKPRLKRLIGRGAAVLFKGSGFYATDYRSESYKESAKKEKPEKSKETKEKAATPAKSDAKNTSETKKPASKNKSGS
ncbi:MAG: zinc ribbon domain-containing protein [Planctomycetota bacterium]